MAVGRNAGDKANHYELEMTGSGAKEVFVWTNPPGTKVPLTRSPFRFAIGTPMGPSTNSWRVWVRGKDIYVKCRDNFGEMKASLHASGNWRFGFTEEFAESRPDLLPEGKDRVWTKWRPALDDPSRPVIGFQIVALSGTLYLGPEKRRSWPSSVIFIEPATGDEKITVVSVVVVQSQVPVRITGDTHGAIVAILPLEDDWTAQVIATYEKVGTMEETIAGAFRKAIAQMGGPDRVPDKGVFFVHGTRGKDTPWVSAVLFRKERGSKDSEVGDRE